MMPSTTYCHACAQLRDECAEAAKLVALRDRQVAVLRGAAECAAERYEAWADAHHACAMHMPDSADCMAQQNLRDNYRTQANRLRAALSQTED